MRYLAVDEIGALENPRVRFRKTSIHAAMSTGVDSTTSEAWTWKRLVATKGDGFAKTDKIGILDFDGQIYWRLWS